MSSTPPPPPPPGGSGWGWSGPDGTGFGQPSQTPPSGSQPFPPSFEPGGPPGMAPRRNGVAVTSLVLGLIAFPGALLLALVPIIQFVALISPLLAVAAIVLGVVGIRRARRPGIAGGVGMSVAGIILGVINLLLTALVAFGITWIVRECDIDFGASPAEIEQQFLDCAADLGGLSPEEIEELEEQMEDAAP